MKGEPWGSPFSRDSGDETQTLLDGDQNTQFQGVEDLEIRPDCCNLPKAIPYFRTSVYPEIGTLEKVGNL